MPIWSVRKLHTQSSRNLLREVFFIECRNNKAAEITMVKLASTTFASGLHRTMMGDP